jgi:hypothetical protein
MSDVHIIKFNKLSKFYGSYNTFSKNKYKSNVVFFKKAKDAVKFRVFLVKYMERFNEAPKLKFYDDRKNIFIYSNEFEKGKEIFEYGETVEYIDDDDTYEYINDYDIEEVVEESSYNTDIQIYTFERSFIDYYMTVNNLGSVDCFINQQDRIECMNKTRNVVDDNEYKKNLEELYKSI